MKVKKFLALLFGGVILLVAVAGGASATYTPPQWAAYYTDSNSGHEYEVYLFDPNNCVSNCSDRSWDAAKNFVSALGPDWYLATITSQNEQNAITTFAGDLKLNWPNELWLGGYQTPGSPEPTGGWNWVTGEAWNGLNWSPGEPNNTGAGGPENFLGLWGSAGSWGPLGSWNDESNLCNIAGFIIEKGSLDVASVPEPATLLLLGLGMLGLAGLGRKRLLKRS